MHQIHILISFNSSRLIITTICTNRRKQKKKSIEEKKLKTKKLTSIGTKKVEIKTLNKWSSRACGLCTTKQVPTNMRRKVLIHILAFTKSAYTFNLLKRNQSAQVMMSKCGMKGSPMIFFYLNENLMKRIKLSKSEKNKRASGWCWHFSP
jgi:hypothetical protein